MHYLALATDYDGTIAHDGGVDDATLAALERLRASARRLILVTGRELPDLLVAMPRLDLFDLIVAENGAVLYDPANREEQALCDPPPPAFIERLRANDVDPLSVGRVIVATWEPNEGKVLDAIRDLQLELQITFNKGAVMVLPGGVNKATGLRAALARLELSPLNCVGVGDAENDLAFLDLCGLPVAVANALDTVKDRAALVTAGARGAGVAELVDRLLATDLAELDASALRGRVALAQDGDEPLLYSAQRESVLLTGQSGGGKSTLTLGLLERIAAAGLQWCVLDPEGDYEGTEDAVTEGSSDAMPEAAQVLDLVRKTHKGVVANMLAVPIADRPAFLARLLPEILALRSRIGRPHVVVVDEAHHMLPRDWDPGGAAVPADLEGFLFVTTHPEQVSGRVLQCVDRLLVVGRDADKSVAAFCEARGLDVPGDIPDIEPGAILVLDPAAGPVRRMQSIAGAGTRRRHRRKYAEGRLGEDTSFYFRGEDGRLKLRAHNLTMFVDLADGVDGATWDWHRGRGDYSQWLQECVKDPELADEVRTIE
ncbi:MAG: HAD hydrolase family protein, partial [Gemmatimonadaceae bacterium]|nr:HAD hydrolase family protein [Acetobacteraceae bacterium]